MRVIKWILDRCSGHVDAKQTPIGYIPLPKDIDTHGIDLDLATLTELLSVNKQGWIDEAKSVSEYLISFGNKLPTQLASEQARITEELGKL